MADASWHTDAFPELRAGPPWVMAEMIAAQPALAAEMLATPPPGTEEAAAEIAATLAAGRAVSVVGCGTSEHASHAVAALLAAAVPPGQRALVRARPAFSAAIDPADGGLCLALSHEGETRATALAVAAARGAGARIVAITQAASASVARSADHVLVTPRRDESWCHTIGYTSPLLAGAAIARRLGGAAAPPAAVRDLLSAAIGLEAAPVAEHLAGGRVVLCAGAGIDHVTARELALKIAEGARMASTALELETVLHGQLAGHEPPDALVLVAVADEAEHERVSRRAGQVARAAAAIGLPVAALLSARHDRDLAPELTPAGRLVVELPDASLVDPRLAGLIAGAGALQNLTLGLAHARGLNPDLIRREERAYREAAQVADRPPDW